MSRLWLLSLVVLPVTSPVWAQSTETLRVTVLDAFDDVPLSGAVVELYQQGILAASRIADIDGQVTFSVTVVGVEELPETGFHVRPPYPNPSSGSITLPFGLARSGPVTVAVFDVLGRSVVRSVEALSAGSHEARLDLGGVSPGVYYARLEQAGRGVTAPPIVVSSGRPGVPGISFTDGGEENRPARKGTVGPNDYDVLVTAVEYEAKQVPVSLPEQTDVAVRLDLAAVPAARVVVVDSTQLSLASMTESKLTFSIEGVAPTLESGDILVGEQGGTGFLRRVISVDADVDSARVVTEQATLVDAIERGVLMSTISFGAAGKRQGWTIDYTADGLAFCEEGLSLFCLEGLTLWEGDFEVDFGPRKRVFVSSGGLTFEPTIDLSTRIRSGSVVDFGAVVNGELSFVLDVATQSDAPFVQQGEVPIFSARRVVRQFVGPVPVVEIVKLTIVAGFDVDTGPALYFEPGLDAGVDLQVGARYDSASGSWVTVDTRQTSFQGHTPRWNPFSATTLRGYVRPRVDVEFYGVAGPTMAFEPYLRQEGTASESGWAWTMAGGVAAWGSFDVSVLDEGVPSYSPVLASIEEELASDAGSMPVSVTNTVGMELVVIPAGSFEMGDTLSVTTPVHEVSLTRNFQIGKHEVNQAEYLEVMGVNPSNFSSYADTVRHRPVEQVSWFDAVAFANALSVREGLAPCYDESGGVPGGDIYACEGYRLPTEAEWEYATRAGTATTYFFGDDPGRLSDFAWSFANRPGRTRDVGTRLPNPWGLHDVYGNVWEWIHDWYSSSYYAESPPSDPPGPSSGIYRVARGGGWSLGDSESVFRSGSHQGIIPEGAVDWLGFRVARTAP